MSETKPFPILAMSEQTARDLARLPGPHYGWPHPSEPGAPRGLVDLAKRRGIVMKLRRPKGGAR